MRKHATRPGESSTFRIAGSADRILGMYFANSMGQHSTQPFPDRSAHYGKPKRDAVNDPCRPNGLVHRADILLSSLCEVQAGPVDYLLLHLLLGLHLQQGCLLHESRRLEPFPVPLFLQRISPAAVCPVLLCVRGLAGRPKTLDHCSTRVIPGKAVARQRDGPNIEMPSSQLQPSLNPFPFRLWTGCCFVRLA